MAMQFGNAAMLCVRTTSLVIICAVAIFASAAEEGGSVASNSGGGHDNLTAGFKLQPLHFEVQHPYDLKLEERYSFDKSTDTHDLWVLSTDKPHAPPPNKTAARTELRLKDDKYKPGSGLHMLDCDMYIVPGTFACITQVFGTGPMAMIVVDPQGTISDLRTHTVIAKEMNGKWFNWKIVHDPDATGKGAIKIYIDNELADGEVSAKKQTSYYFKCGVYSRHGSDRSEVKVRNLKYWIKEPADGVKNISSSEK